MGCGSSHSSVNQFFGILISNIKSPGQMENGFLHFDTLAFQNTQNANWNKLTMRGALTWQSSWMSLYQSLILTDGKWFLTLWHIGLSKYSKRKLIWIGNMRCGHPGIRMDDFLLVYNIAPSSYTFLCNNLSLQIYNSFIMWAKVWRHLGTSIGPLYGLWLFTYKFK